MFSMLLHARPLDLETLCVVLRPAAHNARVSGEETQLLGMVVRTVTLLIFIPFMNEALN